MWAQEQERVREIRGGQGRSRVPPWAVPHAEEGEAGLAPPILRVQLRNYWRKDQGMPECLLAPACVLVHRDARDAGAFCRSRRPRWVALLAMQLRETARTRRALQEPGRVLPWGLRDDSPVEKAKRPGMSVAEYRPPACPQVLGRRGASAPPGPLTSTAPGGTVRQQRCTTVRLRDSLQAFHDGAPIQTQPWHRACARRVLRVAPRDRRSL